MIIKKTIILFFLSAMFLPAQIKIGDIEVSEEIAKEFFYYCQTNPDTVVIKLPELVGEEDMRNFEILDRLSLTGRHFLTHEDGGAVKRVYAFSWLIPRKPTEANLCRWFVEERRFND